MKIYYVSHMLLTYLLFLDVIGVVKGSNVKTVVCKNGKEKRLIEISLEDEE